MFVKKGRRSGRLTSDGPASAARQTARFTCLGGRLFETEVLRERTRSEDTETTAGMHRKLSAPPDESF